MKKILFVLALAGLGTSSAMAQEAEIPTSKYSVVTNSFWDNWFAGGGLSLDAAFTSQESGVSKMPFSDKRGTIGLNAFVGKWATPNVGFRAKFEGIWSRQTNTEKSHPLYNTLNSHVDVLINASNLVCGYNENRVWNLIPYVGIGEIHNFDNGNDNLSLQIGLLNNFRINDRLQFFADLKLMGTDGDFDGAANDKWSSYGQTQFRHWDKKVGVDLGLTYNFSWRKGGKTTWEKAPDVEALMALNKEQMDALNQSLKEQQDENAQLRKLLASKTDTKATVVENTKEFVGTAASVFFNINSAKVASRKDLVNVKELAEYAKANNTKIVVTGYADSKTGSAEYNQQLSQKRANTVADELVKMGVNRDNIITEAMGGVDNLSPFSYNRRATVKIQ